ncbi:unnamed protein product [Dovyalis caffra]|uniref:Uncharacterized protein n=1 Tax=Dovyalis caffra TaxID=77055 RepID=A0AAV1SUE0_9ROSI|nr:unnamed protein product [Dovyalis caffra]
MPPNNNLNVGANPKPKPPPPPPIPSNNIIFIDLLQSPASAIVHRGWVNYHGERKQSFKKSRKIE